MLDLDELIEQLKKAELLTEIELRELCMIVKDIISEESSVQPISSPVVICGDIHGQFFDFLEIFRINGQIPNSRFVFLGDYVDRGYHSCETIQLLLLYKARFPDCITLLRGNHESRQITQVYGFYEECFRKYGNADVWCFCTDLFDCFSIAAVIDMKIFCVHGGLSPFLPTIDQIRLIDRKQEIPPQGVFCDLVWSDPAEIETWSTSPRGAGFVYGSAVVNKFNHINGLDLICRAHQLVQEGYQYLFAKKNLITVWSAPNYCYRCGNVASTLSIDEYHDRKLTIFKEVNESKDLGFSSFSLPNYFI